jgi:hypothetical protein
VLMKPLECITGVKFLRWNDLMFFFLLTLSLILNSWYRGPVRYVWSVSISSVKNMNCMLSLMTSLTKCYICFLSTWPQWYICFVVFATSSFLDVVYYVRNTIWVTHLQYYKNNTKN